LRQVGRDQGRRRKVIGQLLGQKGFVELLSLWPVLFFAFVVISLILWKPRGKTEVWTEMTAEERYMLAKKIFTRDPSTFKDKDSDGIEDELDKDA
jgi:hypothetical protein